MIETIVLLHGFSGTRRAWDQVVERLDPERYRPLPLDIRGHGAAADARPIELEACVADVATAAPERFVLCGYSMGGRVALHVALAHAERIDRLVITGSTAGIDDPQERAARREADDALAAWADEHTIEEFADRWMGQPIFAGNLPSTRPTWREDLCRNDPRALAAALRGLGTARLPPLWDRLGELTMPVTVVVGEHDLKFIPPSERMVASIPDARLVVVPGVGHGVPREAPDVLAAVLAG